jgi:hypothetical protein
VTVTLHLKPDVEAGLVARAQASGMALEEYLLSLVDEAALPEIPSSTAARQSTREETVRRMLEFGARHRLSLNEPITRKLHEEPAFNARVCPRRFNCTLMVLSRRSN